MFKLIRVRTSRSIAIAWNQWLHAVNTYIAYHTYPVYDRFA